MAEGAGWRAAAFARLGAECFDLAVVGGGITGAGIARDAVLRGLRVVLLERADFAAGTSSRSSRLVHGGVRYLEHGHLRLVFEASRERRILLRIAPHLVQPLAFTWPVYRGARISRARLALGLGLYDLLALFRNVGRHERLSRGELLAAEPGLRPEGLLGGARYWDARADDARLTLANAIAAAEGGAVVLNHAEVVEIAGRQGDYVVEVRDRAGGPGGRVRTAAVVNATGPWSDAVRALEGPVPGSMIAGSSGAHVAVPRARVGNRDAVTMLHPEDGRVLFVLPAGDLTIIGTTETATPAGKVEVRATRDDVSYMLAAANRYFPGAALEERDVVAAWAGIRPLARQPAGGDLGAASREHAIKRGPLGVVHVTGGKLTTYRAMAAQVVNAVTGRRASRSPGSDRVPLPGGERPPAALLEEAGRLVADEGVRARLVAAYGTRWREVWALAAADRWAGERLVPALPVIGAELIYGVTREMAVTLGDLLIRRTGLAFSLPDQGRAVAGEAACRVAPLLGWDSVASAAALGVFADEVNRVFGVQ